MTINNTQCDFCGSYNVCTCSEDLENITPKLYDRPYKRGYVGDNACQDCGAQLVDNNCPRCKDFSEEDSIGRHPNQYYPKDDNEDCFDELDPYDFY
jgi:hypothetical protein